MISVTTGGEDDRRVDGITYEAAIEAAVWEHLNTMGPAGAHHVYWAVRTWQEAHGYLRRLRPDPDPTIGIAVDAVDDERFELVEPHPDLTAAQRAVWDALERPRVRDEVAGIVGLNPESTSAVLRRLERRGLVEVCDGLWFRR